MDIFKALIVCSCIGCRGSWGLDALELGGLELVLNKVKTRLALDMKLTGDIHPSEGLPLSL